MNVKKGVAKGRVFQYQQDKGSEIYMHIISFNPHQVSVNSEVLA